MIILNIGDTKTKLLLGLAKTPLVFYPHYKYHLPLPTVLMIENTNLCNAECVMCPRDTLARKRRFMDFGLFGTEALTDASIAASGSTFPIGTTTVSDDARDPAGKHSSQAPAHLRRVETSRG